VTRCGADKGVQGPCIAFLSFVPQPRDRQLVGSQRSVYSCALRHPLATRVLPPHLAPRPPAPPLPSAQHLLSRPRVQH
jgi:hypothetical protein